MNCKHCNAEIPEKGMFCPFCGQKAEAEPEIVNAPVEEPAEIAAEIPEEVPAVETCAACGSPLEPGSRFCRECGHYMTDAPVRRQRIKPAAKEPKVRKPVNWGLIAAICGALVLALLITAGFVTDWFGLTGPVRRLALAAKRTAPAENLTIELALSAEDATAFQEIDGTVQMSFVPSKRQLILWGDLKMAGESGQLAIYKDHFIMGTPDGSLRIDISKELDEFFDGYEEALKEERSLKDLVEDLDEDAAEDIDFDELEKCLKKYGRRLNSSLWLKKNAGYSVSREESMTVHTFQPDLYLFLRESLPFFESAFKDTEDYQEALDSLEENKSDLQDVNLTVKIGVKGGQLAEIAVKINEKENADTALEINFTQIGKTEINTDKLEKLLKDAVDMNSGLQIFPDAGGGIDFLSAAS